MMQRCGLLAGLFVVVSCGEDTVVYVASPAEDVRPSTEQDSGGFEPDSQDDRGTIVAVPDVQNGDVTAPEPGAFGAACGGNSDCLSNFCVEGPTGYICTESCLIDCPDGYDCKSVSSDASADVVFLCMPRLKRSCTPCADDLNCPGGACIEIDGERRCAASCSDAEPCVAGYDCADMPEASGSAGHCLPSTGSCTCLEGQNGGKRSCSATTADGTCYGISTCDPSVGWSACDAKPVAELCDGVDNDCNGLIDDGLPVFEPCENDVEGVGACGGVLVCLGGQGWLCQGPSPTPEACDFADNDCDGQTDEDFKSADGNWTQDEHCGTCGNDCGGKFAHATAVCGGSPTSPLCVVAACDADYFQLNDFQCMLPPAVACQPCTDDNQCFGGSCVVLDNQKVCVSACGEAAKSCSEGYTCQDVGGVERCMPVTKSCVCKAQNDGKTRACQVENEFGTCYGAETCTIELGWSACSAAVAAPESCNGEDDDCNGAVDDGVKPPDALCAITNDAGTCTGSWFCGESEGATAWWCSARTPSSEVCNYQDDDCDGQVDEDWQDAAGRYVSDEACGACGVPCADVIPNATAFCSGDGTNPQCQVQFCDEGFWQASPLTCLPVTDATCSPCQTDANCPTPGDKCLELDGGKFCGRDCSSGNLYGEEGCSPGFECDAETTQCRPISGSCTCLEADLGESRTCLRTTSFGTCYGQETCDPALGFGGCTATDPTAEVCDGADNDCNSAVDDVPGRGTACVIENAAGSCAGVNDCALPEAALECVGQTPAAETCNYLDDDCDGSTDEGQGDLFTSCSQGKGICQRFGFFECADDGGGSVCNAVAAPGGPETCDGLDDDCDGLTDETEWATKGTVCEVGIGTCRRTGVRVCDAADPSGPVVCSADPGTAGAEVCNGADDDCDGATDEGWPLTGKPCTLGIGACVTAGVFRCDPADAQAPVVCDAAPDSGAVEVCNGLDDDCDGSTDEGPLWTGKGTVCLVGSGVCQRAGVRLCDPGAPAGATVCSADAGPSGAEVCDGLDNDCDGTTDENALWADKGTVCAVGTGSCVAAGVKLCDASSPSGATVCSVQPGPSQPEVCNGLDDDCDSLTDEDAAWANKAKPCTLGKGICEATGTFSCNAGDPGGPTICNAAPAVAETEVCNGLDDDCDGQTDEGALWSGKGQVCVVGAGQCIATGITVCNLAAPAGPTVCSVSPKATGSEVCNGLDDDCDGATDEDAAWANKGQVCNVGTGQCVATGTFGCNAASPGGPTVCSVSPLATGTESCDGLDNDCDGATDENAAWANKGQPCTAGIGACVASGVYACNTSAPTGPTLCTADAAAAVSEVCDGLDNDCDGATDEGASWANKGKPCTAGSGVCTAPGVYKCNAVNPSAATACDAVPSSAGSEVCNGLDDDCDGLTDEDSAWTNKGKPCSAGTGACQRAGVFTCNTASPAGALVCDAVQGSAGTETCNGLDDDCDGQTDEGASWANKGKPCTAGVGTCQAAGVYVCNATTPAGATVCDATPGVAGTEVCDGLDNDCDSATDEGAAWVNKGKPCNAGVGVCQVAGVNVCNATSPAGALVCNVSAAPAGTEVCNGLDDDCDGQIDEGANWANKGTPCTTGTGACQAAGVYVCNATTPAAVTVCNAVAGASGVEVCNALDDDCDGATDETTWADKGTVCTVGSGLCQTTGTRQCNAANPAGATVCGATPGAAGTEVCDGLDNDCDGSTDEGALWVNKGTPCTAGLGVCQKAGITVCNTSAPAASTVCSVVGGSPGTESCDGLDNDCDGQTDEGTLWVTKGQACTVGVGVCQASGVKVCDAAAPTGALICNGVAGASGVESCDGLDNDCDGATDEGSLWTDKGSVCTTGTGTCQASGTKRCNVANPAGATICSAVAGTAATEACNGLDDDCDGATDEGALWSNKGTICTAGSGVCLRTGLFVCNSSNPATATVCSVVAGAGATETCDALDNDCDGATDETFLDKGTVCSVGQGICQRAGVKICNTSNPATTVCSVTAGATGTEVCNGLDDDCDGSTDETHPTKGTVCTVGSGICLRAGVTICDAANPAGATVCSVTAGAAATEVCDALDNDCDGSTDETHPDKGTVCTSGVGACGRVGVKICNASAPGGATVCNATAGTAGTESCNTLDDDCDGATDDGWLNGGKYDQNVACGNCSTDCTAIYNKANAFGVCNATGAPTCVLTCCKPGNVNPACSGQTYFDLNAVPGDGCEFLLDTTAIYVSSSDLTANTTAGCGRGPTGTGAGNRPCLSIASGLAEAVSSGRTKVLVAGGAYYEAVTLVAGKSLLGGFNPSTWSRDITSNTTAIFGNTGSGNRKAVIAKDIQSGATLLEGFTIYGENATGSGQTSYALWISNCGSALTVRSNIIWGGYGGPGANGGSGASGGSGSNGAIGKNAYQPTGAYNCYENCIGKGAENVGGTGGAISCGGVSAAGGAGGQAGCPDWDEGQNLCTSCPIAPNTQTLSAGSGAAGAGGGGAGGAGGCDSITDQECADPNCACRTPNDPSCVNGGTPSVGENGPTGVNGTGGAGAGTGTGTVVSGEWVGTSGVAGVAGSAGKGGGGGGAGGGVEGYASAACGSNGASDIGGSGGGGGSGGCGAAPGAAGSGGGGSFAIFVTFPSQPTTVPTLTANELNRGFGGIGGDGGSGGTGGSGGNGGVGGGGGTLGSQFWCASAGAKGGEGGRGGHGGGGGGGSGGASYGVFVSGQGSAAIGTWKTLNVFKTGGAGGAAGAGGGSGAGGAQGTAGTAGTAANSNF
ncbi:MAG: hypothetical protein IV100_04130 [Myxococcales bacterium]|nr:hypothetical protein [Myxococcales bacterium]